jgi:hypothetical protein
MPKVIIWRDGAIETEFDPGHRDWRMGRSETNDITLLDPRKSVSRFHAELREENGRWVFIDLNSQNGSWKDGQRVNRLVLEHGHEVLFGDYKLAFEDVKVAAPPPMPIPAAERTADVAAVTADVPIAPDQTLLMPGKAAVPSASAPPSAPAPVVRPAAKAKAPRKGVNPLILVLFLIAMLGAAAAVAWKVLSERTVEPRVVETTPPTDPEPEPAQRPAVVPPVTPPATDPTVVPTPAPGSPTTTPVTPAPAPTPVPPVATTPGSVPAAPVTPVQPPGGKAAPGPGAPARPKRLPPTAPKDNPAVATRYEEGRRALSAGRFVEAERAFQAVVSQQPGFRDAASLLEQARQGQVAARQKSLADAKALEANGDWSRAVAAYERAGASDEAAAARTKMTAAGDDAYRKARQFDARNRPPEAITWYQRAVEWLPDSDARKATAQERLAALKGGGA